MSLFAILFTLALSVTEASRSVIYYGREFRQGMYIVLRGTAAKHIKTNASHAQGEVGYTVKNYLGQDVIVTEPLILERRTAKFGELALSTE